MIKERTLAEEARDALLAAPKEAFDPSQLHNWLPIDSAPDNMWVEVMGFLASAHSSILDMDGGIWVAYARKRDLSRHIGDSFNPQMRNSDWVWQLSSGDYLEHFHQVPTHWRAPAPFPPYNSTPRR